MIKSWQKRDCLAFDQSGDIIKPQYAIKRLCEMTCKHDVYVTTEVGQHQMWAAQYFAFEQPNRWMTSGWPWHHGIWSAIGNGCAGRAS
jgi:acetolactate synthase-1/2/3 large subunit